MKSDSYSRYLRSDIYRDFLNGSKKKSSMKGIRSIVSFSTARKDTCTAWTYVCSSVLYVIKYLSRGKAFTKKIVCGNIHLGKHNNAIKHLWGNLNINLL